MRLHLTGGEEVEVGWGVPVTFWAPHCKGQKNVPYIILTKFAILLRHIKAI